MPIFPIVNVALSDLLPAQENPKGHRPDLIGESIDEFGFLVPMVRDVRTGELVGGHGRLETLLAKKEAGEPAPAGVKVSPKGDWLVPVVEWRSTDDEHAKRALLGLNQEDKGGWDQRGLLSMLAHLEPTSLAGTGFTLADVGDLRTLLVPPNLDDLHESLGAHVPADVWPVVRLLMPAAMKSRFEKAWATLPGTNDGEKAGHILAVWPGGEP